MPMAPVIASGTCEEDGGKYGRWNTGDRRQNEKEQKKTNHESTNLESTKKVLVFVYTPSSFVFSR